MIVVDALPEHGEDFLRRPIRQADVDEWVAGTGKPVRALLPNVWGTDASHPRALLNENGECICLWGVSCDAEPDVGYVWLIAGVEAEERARAIHRFWRSEIGWMHSFRPTLHALAYSRNLLHLHWLEEVGFTVQKVVELNPFSPPFLLYVRNDVH